MVTLNQEEIYRIKDIISDLIGFNRDDLHLISQLKEIRNIIDEGIKDVSNDLEQSRDTAKHYEKCLNVEDREDYFKDLRDILNGVS